MEETTFSRKQLQRTLAQRVRALYYNKLGHQPSKVTCQLFDKKLAIAVEGAVTRTEQLLLSSDRSDLARQVRVSVEEILRPKLQVEIEEVVGEQVLDILLVTHLNTGYASIVALLSEVPKLPPESNLEEPDKPLGLATTTRHVAEQ